MDFKVVKQQESDEKSQKIEKQENNTLFYENPTLIFRQGCYYIGFETDEILIEEWEALEVYEHPDRVYDLIISHRRKFYFNAAEDSVRAMLEKPLKEP